jgi:DMSO reductase anchor subunit
VNQDGNPPPSHLALERAIRLVFLDNWPQVLITLGGIGSTLSTILLGLQEKDRVFWWWMLWLSLLLIIVGSAVSWWRTPGVRSLKERVTTLEDLLQSAEQSYRDLSPTR